MARKKEKRKTEDVSVYDLSKKELQEEIRKRTSEVNWRIIEYRESIESGKMKKVTFIERNIEALKEASAYKNKKGEIKIPKPKAGEIALGFSGKNKLELQRQLLGLRQFIKYDEHTPEGIRKAEERTSKAYRTFTKRYGHISRKDYDNMINTMNVIKNVLKDYGYEDYGESYARMYSKATDEGKRKFASYVEQGRKEASGKSVEDLLDVIADNMRKDGVL